jgi:predicted MFS family arabinose efflux permease
VPTNSSRQRLWTAPFALLCLATFGHFTALGMQSPVLPRYVTGPLGGTAVDVGVAAVLFSVAAVVARVPLVLFPSRTVLLPVGCLLLAASIATLAVPSVPVLFGARVLTGASTALFFTTAMAHVYDVARGERHGSAMSYFTLVVYSGLLLGPATGETVRAAIGYDAVWFTAAGLATATALAAVLVDRAASYPGATGAATWTGWPGIPAGVVLPTLLVVAAALGPDGYTLFVPLYADHIGQHTVTVDLVVLAATTLVLRAVGAGWLDRFAAERVALHSFTAGTAGLLVIAVVANPAGLLVGTVLLGAGQAFSFPALVNLAVRRTRDRSRAAVLAVITAGHDLTFGLAGLVLGGIVQAAGFAMAFLAAAGASAAGLAVLAATARTDQRNRREP